jgi:peptidyl-prolyl cis-trans isomerase D
VLRATGHKPAVPRALAEVRDTIVTRLKNEGARKLAKEAGDAILAKLDAGAVWDQALAAAQLTPSARQYVPRSDATLAPPLRDALFAAPRPRAGLVVYRGVEVNDGDYGLFAFSAVRDGSAAETAEQRRARVQELGARLGAGDMAAYAAELERTADIERNPKALE